ncbi:FecR domain-containing protein [uncultured Kriegella sp.]|uniref:FecR family protein n=1 Tax=uncultured Kriegella sp. TaxID=1798910 RepID=UPI0030DCA69C|tara:strand:+ start:126094 stop:127281 length:1188 start_codon:yes stop_codon:yes gene_type:complete
MYSKTTIKEVLQKFASNQCTPEETAWIISYFKENANVDDMPTVEVINELLLDHEAMDTVEADEIFERILTAGREKEFRKPQRIERKRKVWRYTGVAAALLIGLLCISYFYYSPRNEEAKKVVDFTPTPDAITLQLQNGSIAIISENGNSKVIDAKGNLIGKQKGNRLIYDSLVVAEELTYNTLRVPFGKKFELLLSDGTTAFLNAGTSLKYPVKFLSGKDREVFLDGEAFFDVTKNEKSPFVINATQLNVRVLGTKFNVSNYTEDEVTDVVLVEGSVGLYNAKEKFGGKNTTMLIPGHKGSFSKEKGGIATEKVNTEIYTSWIHGDLVFRNMTFENILKKMERNYNVTITNHNASLAQEKFNASFRKAPIDTVLQYFKTTYSLDIHTNGKEITIR